MTSLTQRQKNIVSLYFPEKGLSSSTITAFLKGEASLVTIRRDIQELVKRGYLEQKGKGRTVVYHKTSYGILLTPVDETQYQKIDIDTRGGNQSFNESLFRSIPTSLFTSQEVAMLDRATAHYHARADGVTESIRIKEMERFVIEMSWKSSKIEGNTYTLLDTERLIREGIVAPGHTKDEATMILNHKRAFSFILEQKNHIQKTGITQQLVEKLHDLLSFDLGIDKGLRKGPVGITGTVYRPLGTDYQIREALEDLYGAMQQSSTVYQRALLALVGISYIQPFADGNKRTARLLANAILIAQECVPLSYRNIEEVSYREAILVFYEKNSILPIKDIFVGQYIFAADNYLVSVK